MATPVEIKAQITGAQQTAETVRGLGQTAVVAMQQTQAAAATVAKVADEASAKLEGVVRRIGGISPKVQRVQAEVVSLPIVAPPVLDAIPEKANQSAQSIRRLEDAARSAGGGLRQMVDSAFQLVGVQSPLGSGLANGASAAQSFASGASAAAGTVGALAAGAVAAVAVIGALAAGLFQAAKGAAAYADAEGKEAEKVGVTVEQWSKLQFAAKMADVSTGELRQGLGKLSEQAVKNSEAFKLLGVSTENVDGTQRATSEILLDVADRFASYEDGITKTRLAQEIFGRSGKELLPLLNEGRAGIERLGAELEQYGGVTTAAAAAQGDRFGDSLDRISTIVDSLWRQFGTRLVPIIADLLEDLVALTGGISKLAFVFDLALIPVKATADTFVALADSVKLAAQATVAFASLNKAFLTGDLAGAKAALAGLAKDYANFAQGVATGIKVVPFGPQPQKAAAPAVETADEKAARKAREKELKDEEKLQTDLYVIRAQGENDLAELVARGERAEIDGRYKAGTISAEDYFAARRELIERDHQLELQAIAVKSAREDDAQKQAAEVEAAETKAVEIRRQSLAALSREQDEDARKRDEQAALEVDRAAKQVERDLAAAAREAAALEAAQRRYAIHRAEMPLHELEAQLAGVQADRNKSAADKRREIIALLQQELALLPAMEEAARKEAASANLDERIRGETKLLQIERARLGINEKLQNAKPVGFTARMNSDLDAMSEKWGNLSGNMAGVLTGTLSDAVEGFGDKVLDVASGVTSIGELGIASFRKLVSGMITAVAEWVAQMTIVRALKAIFNTEQKAEAAQRTATEAPAAAMASIGSWGAAAIIGGAALAAVLAMALAFEKGGRVRGGEQFIRVNERGEETVMNAQATSRFAGLLDAINSGATSAAELQPHLPRPDYGAAARFQVATATASGSAMGMPRVNVTAPEARTEVFVMDGERSARRFLESRGGRRATLRHVGDSRADLGLEM